MTWFRRRRDLLQLVKLQQQEIELQLGSIYQGQVRLMNEMDDLKAQVQANNDLEASAVVLINGIADRIKAAGTDPAALKALTDSLKTSDDALAAAVAANTPGSDLGSTPGIAPPV